MSGLNGNMKDKGYMAQKHCNIIRACLIGGALVWLSGCTWVDVDKTAEHVEVLTSEQAQSCDRLRRTTSQVMDTVGFVKRDAEKQKEELQVLARNTAAELGGNAIVPDSELSDGKQSFFILKCAHLN